MADQILFSLKKTKKSRCNADAIDEVPEYMKVIYKSLLKLFDETESTDDEEMSYRTSYAKERVRFVHQSFHQL